jgi:MerR family mercuric resistance operon transcriptional regulator
MLPVRIGKLARLANVNVQTLRFYEREGLLAKPSRRPSGYREYPANTIGLVILIKHIQALGFSLREIKDVLSLRKVASATFADAVTRLENKLHEIDVKISELRRLRRTLANILKTHKHGAATAFAPAFERHVEQLTTEALAQENRTSTNGRPQGVGSAGMPVQKNSETTLELDTKVRGDTR